MTLYEHVFIARQDLSPQRAQALLDEFGAAISKQGGRVGKTEYWGLRTLAYRIKKNRKGHYMLLNIEAPHETVQEIERQMKLHDDILRFQTVRVDQHDTEPSPPMRQTAKDKSWPNEEPQKAQDINTAEVSSEEIPEASEHNEQESGEPESGEQAPDEEDKNA